MSGIGVTCNQSCREMGTDSLSLAVRFQLSFIKPKFEMNMQNIITSDARVTPTSKELIVLLLLQEWTLFGMPAHFLIIIANEPSERRRSDGEAAAE